MTRRAGGVGIAIRAALTAPALTVFAILVVAVTALVGAAAPGLLQRVQSDSLRYAVGATDAAVRDFGASQRGVPIPGTGRDGIDVPVELGDTWGRVLQSLTDTRLSMFRELREVVGGPRIATDFDAGEAISPDPAAIIPRSLLTLRYDPRLDELVTWSEGREPVAGAEIPEFGLSAPVAEAMGWKLDEVRSLPLSGGVFLPVVLTGIWEPVDAGDPDWRHAAIALQPGRIERGLESPIFTGIGYAAPGDLATPGAHSSDASTTVWFPLDVDAIQAPGAADLVAAMRQFEAQNVVLDIDSGTFFTDGMEFTSTAPTTIAQALVRIDAMSALAALIASGPLAVALVVLALTTRMLAVRRRSSLQLAAARGASLRLRAGVLAAEGLVVGAIGGVGGGIAGAILGQGTGPALWVAPVLAGLTPVVVLPVTGLLVARRRPRADLGATTPVAARRRLVVEAAIVLLAAGSVVLVLTGARSSDGSSPDPLITALPLLLAAVGCVLTLRIVPLVLGLVERGVPSRRGLIALIGPARARRDPALRVAPVLAVVMGVTIALFSVAFSATVSDGIGAAARSAVGADLRVTGPYLDDVRLDALAGLDGVAATAPVYASDQVPGQLPAADLTVTVYVIDAAELAAVQTDPDTAIPLPAEFTSGDGPLPVVASDQLAARVGAETLQLDGRPVAIVATAPSLTPLGSTRTWVAVDRSRAAELVGDASGANVDLLALEPGADPAAVADQALLAVGSGATATTPASAAAMRLDDPALVGLQLALIAATGVVAALLALAIGMTLVLGAPARGRMLALLAAVGFRRSRELGIVVWEVAPAIAVALPIGALVGCVLPVVVIPALDLTGFVGGTEQPDVHLGGWAPLAVLAGFLGVTVLAVLIAALVARRVTAARTLRSIDEEG